MVEIISEEKYNALSDKEKKKYDKKLERQLDKEADKVAKKGFDNAVWTYETGAKAAAAAGTAAAWYNWYVNEDVDGGKKRRKSLKNKRKTKKRLGGMNEPMARELKNRVYFLRRTRTRAREPEPVPESEEVFNMGELEQSLPINTRRKRGSYKQNSRKKRNTSQKDSKTPTSSRKRSQSLGGRTKRRRQ